MRLPRFDWRKKPGEEDPMQTSFDFEAMPRKEVKHETVKFTEHDAPVDDNLHNESW